MKYEFFTGLLGGFLALTSIGVLDATAQESEFFTTIKPTLGESLSPGELGTLDRLVFPDGSGLPSGSGSVTQGKELYSQKCHLCHGADGRGGSAQELAGGIGDLTRDPPDQTIGTYWPFATTLFDFIRRAMPMHQPATLTNNEVYALTAYLLFVNGVVEAQAELDAETLSRIVMPNRHGFEWIDVPGQIE